MADVNQSQFAAEVPGQEGGGAPWKGAVLTPIVDQPWALKRLDGQVREGGPYRESHVLYIVVSDSLLLMLRDGMTEVKMDLRLAGRPTTVTTKCRILYDIPCKVCQDHSSGKHYGIFACDGCAGFFKRSIRRQRQYVCKSKAAGGCLVDKTHRNQCRACRLSKCVQAGMNKDAVQHERGPRNSTLRRQMALYFKDPSPDTTQRPHSPLSLPHPHLQHHHHHQESTSPSTTATTPPTTTTTHTTSNNNNNSSSPYPMAPPPLPPPPPTLPITSALSLRFPPPPMPSVLDLKIHSLRPSIPPSAAAAAGTAPRTLSREIPSTRPPPEVSALTLGREHVLTTRACTLLAPTPKYPHELALPVFTSPETICETAARLLFMNVRWAKHLPAYTALPFRDQLMLLEDGWRELFVLSAAQFLLPVEAGPLLAASGLACQASDRLLPILQDIKLFQDILAKFKAMWVDPTEYACLKAIVLFKSVGEGCGGEVRGLRDPAAVAALQDQAQLTLNKYITTTYPTQPFRFGKLLLLLPSLRSVGSRTIEELFFRRTIGAIPIERIICDMYKTGDF
ncbi:hypothetical protein Pcinc_028130 [Petrolisthes cinctipes]|uniref:Nuclear receptor subfamily 2 group E member 1 n=1 Tax=Petrolisthes cinctipes TaxID=88211 RepID=A0AAE1F3N4_PETCI|nr:hypothetical protein Pcinc_028130 [Petrolisthes cinctipes]